MGFELSGYCRLLKGNSLKGTIPGEALGKLTMLRQLKLQANGLNGTIPQDLGRLNQLTTLELSDNSLHGTIPHLSNLTELIVFAAHNNHLSGQVPQDLVNAPTLSKLALQNNSLGGVLPHNLGKLSQLAVLNLGLNRLVGTIPDFSSMGSIVQISLESNLLTGDT